jgi:hypothetical protein
MQLAACNMLIKDVARPPASLTGSTIQQADVKQTTHSMQTKHVHFMQCQWPGNLHEWTSVQANKMHEP